MPTRSETEKAIYEKWKRENPSKPTEPVAPEVAPTVVDPKYVLPVKPNVVTENMPPPVPYMAMAVSKLGMPIYGIGLQGWARKAWADLTDPMKYFQDQKKISTEAQARITKEYEAGRTKAGQAIEKNLKWSEWGQKMFGITSEELGALESLDKAERAIAKEAGDFVPGTALSRNVRRQVDTTQNLIWGGLALFGIGDETMRAIHSTAQGLDSIADRFNKDTPDNFFEKLVQTGTIAMAKDVITVAGALKDGKIKWSDTKETIDQYQAGSAMVYTMIFEEGKRAEFEKGIAEGKDPIVLAQDLGNIGIELAGSILGDPLTYLGLSLVKPVNIFTVAGREAGNPIKIFGATRRLPWKTFFRIPEFGEIIAPITKGLVGNARIAAQTRHVANAAPEVERLLEKAAKATGEIEASKYLDDAAKAAVARARGGAIETLDKSIIGKGANIVKVGKLKFWNMFALDTESKINVIARDANAWISALLSRENGIDNAYLILRDRVNLSRGAEGAEEAARNLLGKGSAMFSPVGEMVGDILSRVEDADIYNIVLKFGDDPTELHTQLTNVISKVVQDYVPSVGEMHDATEAAKVLRLAGKEVPEKMTRFEELYKDVDPLTKRITQMVKGPMAFQSKTSGAMVTMFMQLVPRSWSRNFQGAFLPMAARIGIVQAAEVMAVAIPSSLNPAYIDTTAMALAKMDGQLEDMVGFVPAAEGISRILGKRKIFGKEWMLAPIRRGEELMARGAEVQAAFKHIQQALTAVVKDVPEYDALVQTLPKEAQSLVFAAMQRADGNTSKMKGILQNWVGKGAIPMKDIIDIPPKLKNVLRDYDMLDAVEEARSLSATSDEFTERIQKLVDTFESVGNKAYNDQVTVNVGFAGREDFALKLNELDGDGQKKAIRELYEAWHATNQKMRQTIAAVESAVDKRLYAMPDEIVNGAPDMSKRIALGEKVTAIKKQLQELDGVTDAAWDRIDDIRVPLINDIQNETDLKKIWSKEYQSGSFKLSLSKLYPNADITVMTPKAFKQLAWTAYFEFASDTHKMANTTKYEKTMDALNGFAEVFDSTIDDMAGNPAGDNPFKVMEEMHESAMKWQETHAWERFFRAQDFNVQGKAEMTLRQLAQEYSAAHPTWGANIDNYIKEVNLEATKSTQIAQIARNLGIPTSWKKPGDMDKTLLKRINEELAAQAASVDTSVGKVTKTRDAFRYISKSGGMNPAVFKEIMGETIGKQRMIPGLTNKKAKGIDELGIKLWEGGFISREEADDAAFVTNFLRTFKPTEIPDDARIAAMQAAEFKDYERLQDINNDTAERALKAYAARKGIKPLPVKPVEEVAQVVDNVVDDLTPPENAPYMDEAGNLIDPTLEQARAAFKLNRGRVQQEMFLTQPDAMKNMQKGMKADLGKWAKAVVNDWGATTKVAPSDNFAEAFRNFEKAIKPRMDHVRLEAATTAISTRNFILHDYNKTYMDHAMSMLLGNSFHYWTTRTYARALETITENPKYANMYMRYKEYNQKRHSDQPEWYRQNVQIDSIFGMQLDNPYFMNLEAAINPMYGLTGVDFNDPRKCVDWMSRIVNDMNKMGPTFSPLVSWGIGLAMFNKGEEEAGQRWFGRALPQSGIIKEGLFKLGLNLNAGMFIQNNEIDPFVNFLEGGVDPYERNRVAASLANMVANKEVVNGRVVTQELMIEAARTKSGDIWDAGVEAAATARFGSSASSFFFGAGLKPRTQQDMLLEKFWQDYSTMVSSSSMMTPEQYRQSWDKMRDNEDYGMFMDALLLSRKSGAAMESAYAYNVFSRVPPGELNGILETVGIRPDLVQKFYDNKGDFSKMGLLPQDKERFMAGAIDIGAILAMPDNPSREAWAQAKDQYKTMNTVLQGQFGDGILDLMSEYYSAPERDVFLDDNPDVKAAMEYKDKIVMANPVLMEYYGGISTMERYYGTVMENELIKKYGQDIKDTEAEYYDLLTSKEQSAFMRAHPELKAYRAEKKVYQDKIDRRIVVLGSNLPPLPTPQIRPDASPANVPQENLMNLQQPVLTTQEWTQALGEPVMRFIYDYWTNGTKLPPPVTSRLDFEASKNSMYDGKELLQTILISMQNTR